MKTISLTQSNVKEAMAEIDSLSELVEKDKDCLRLLTEEMFSMVNCLLDMGAPDFQISRDDNLFTLQISAHTPVSEEAREHFLSLSSDGHNAAAKGLKGILGSVMETFFYSGSSIYTSHHTWSGGLNIYDSECQMWELSRYMEAVADDTEKEEWDELEKSIIAKFADNVVIGVRSGKLEMTITKEF